MTPTASLIADRRKSLMHFHHINLLAVLVAAISTMAVGFLWYSPLLFAKPWMREMGYDPNDKARMEEMKKSAGPAYGGSFVATLQLTGVLFMKQSMKLFAINTGYQLVCYLVMSAILTVWK